MNFFEKAAKARRIYQEKGVPGLERSAARFLKRRREKRNYQKWIETHRVTAEKRAEMCREIEAFSSKPKISVVMPVYNVDEKWLRLCIESVLDQIYKNWEFCIADDASPAPHIRRVLEEYAALDERVKVVFRPANGHISAASNSALNLATGNFVALLDHDDELSEDALFWVAKEINEFPETKMIYSDEDLIDETGKRYEPKFKPDWSRDLFYSLNLITHLSVYKTDVLRKIDGFRLGAEGSQDYDLALRVIEQISEREIRHIPRVLYHWRAIRGSVAFGADEKPYAHERAREALRLHFERTGRKAEVSETVYHLHRTRYLLPENAPPKVSLILQESEDFEFTKNAIKNFIAHTDYKNFEIILIKKAETRPSGTVQTILDSGDSKTSRDPAEARISASFLKTVVCDRNSEAERLNYAAAQTDGEILCFADLNLHPLSKDWLTELVSFAFQKEIGAVGAKLFYPDETVLHGGLIAGINDQTVSVAHHSIARDDGGNFGRAHVVNNFSAVSISCLAIRKEVFEEAGGFDAENLPERFFDADFCLRLGEKNYRIVFTPYAELIKRDGTRRLNIEKEPTAGEKEFFREKWQKFIGRDPFYNPNLSYKTGDFSIEI